jgi:hypothetical protein
VFKPAENFIFFFFCPATHVLSNVTIGCVHFPTSVPFTPTMVLVSNLTLVETKMDYSAVGRRGVIS